MNIEKYLRSNQYHLFLHKKRRSNFVFQQTFHSIFPKKKQKLSAGNGLNSATIVILQEWFWH